MLAIIPTQRLKQGDQKLKSCFGTSGFEASLRYGKPCIKQQQKNLYLVATLKMHGKI